VKYATNYGCRLGGRRKATSGGGTEQGCEKKKKWGEIGVREQPAKPLKPSKRAVRWSTNSVIPSGRIETWNMLGAQPLGKAYQASVRPQKREIPKG